MSADRPHAVFAYGLLNGPETRAKLGISPEYVCRAELRGYVMKRLLNLTVVDHGPGMVEGVVWRLSDAELEKVDDLERGFERRHCVALLDDHAKTPIKCFVYAIGPQLKEEFE